MGAMRFAVALLLLAIVKQSQGGNEFEQSYRIESEGAGIHQLVGRPVSFREQVKPILEQRCVVCHSCYDAPCQLKLTAPEGLVRGASKAKVYDGERLTPAVHTRLFMDAQSTEQWRQLGFFPVLGDALAGSQTPDKPNLLAAMLALKSSQLFPVSGKLPDSFKFELDRDLECPKPEEFDAFRAKHPDWGMPYGFPGLSGEQSRLVNAWLEQGAKMEERLEPDAQTQRLMAVWEDFLNQPGLKHRLTARYLYEHLFLGHLYFEQGAVNRFFTLVRSKTAPGQALQEIVTDLPYQNPGVERVYYRLKPVTETIVDKTHFVYALSDSRLEKIRRWFIDAPYTVAALPGYAEKRATNPFLTYAAIPADARYRFLLDEAAYFIAGFIKGPVCRGQIALNAIQDRFWVMFVSPDFDYSGRGSQFLANRSEILSLPAAEGENISSLGWYDYDTLAQQYLQDKENFVAAVLHARQRGLDETDIWDGERSNRNAALTVFRHFDSATVVKGFVGSVPKTAWVIDYPLLERLHYLLVAGFDVYGTLWHQLATRKYMDYLRMDGENNFLRFMPAGQREAIHALWYAGILPEMAKLMTEPLFSLEQESGVKFRSQGSQAEFLQKVARRLGQAASTGDAINGCLFADCSAGKLESISPEILQPLRQLTAISGTVLQTLPETAFLRIKVDEEGQEDPVFTLLVDRDLKNLSTLFVEELRHNPKRDKLTVVPGFLGSYPNVFFHVAQRDLPKFVSDLAACKSDRQREAFYATYAIRRTHPHFWAYFDWLNQRYKRQAGLEAGLFDLNRYDNR